MMKNNLPDLLRLWNGEKIAIANVRESDFAVGYQGNLLYRNDIYFFRQMTLGHTVLMGRKTADSINPNWANLPGSPLPGRRSIIATSDTIVIKGETNGNRLFVIGGPSIWQQTLTLCDAVYLTRSYGPDGPADAFFPKDLFVSNFRYLGTKRSDFLANPKYVIEHYEAITKFQT